MLHKTKVETLAFILRKSLTLSCDFDKITWVDPIKPKSVLKIGPKIWNGLKLVLPERLQFYKFFVVLCAEVMCHFDTKITISFLDRKSGCFLCRPKWSRDY